MEIIQEYFSALMTAIKGTEVAYALLILALFILPRLLVRMGIPMALTAFFMGAASHISLGFSDGDNVISLFASLGIIALFLFAGMEVDLSALRAHSRRIAEHISVRIMVIVIFSLLVLWKFGLSTPACILLALAIATPSTGFILDSLANAPLNEDNKYWIKLKAISAELVALGLLLVVTQSGDGAALAGSITIIVTLTLVLPFLFKRLSVVIERIAPGSEFNFLLILAVIFGLITKKLGAYYLVGAFIVGIMAGKYRRETPNLATEEMLKSLRLFAAFFMPFYFFNAGLKFPSAAISIESAAVAGLFFAVSFPVKLASIMIHRRISLKESWRRTLPVALSLMPNLVFGLVLAEIIKVKMQVPVEIYGGLVIYTLFISMLAPLLLRTLGKGDDVDFLSTEDQIMQSLYLNQPDPKNDE